MKSKLETNRDHLLLGKKHELHEEASNAVCKANKKQYQSRVYLWLFKPLQRSLVPYRFGFVDLSLKDVAVDDARILLADFESFFIASEKFGEIHASAIHCKITNASSLPGCSLRIQFVEIRCAPTMTINYANRNQDE